MNDSVVLIQFLIIRIMRAIAEHRPPHISSNQVKLQQSSFDLHLSMRGLETGERERERTFTDFKSQIRSQRVHYLLLRVFINRSVELCSLYTG